MKALRTIFALSFLTFISTAFTTDISIIRPAIGDQAPDIIMENPDGQTIKLSQLRGKVVFIDFWASWCRTCRVENSNITKAYGQYHAQNFDVGNGFEVFSVSLDKDKDVWVKAIENDRLIWPYHVSDLKKWDSPIVETYNFTYLPHNLLIDGEGKIIAKGLFGNKLEEVLAAHLAE